MPVISERASGQVTIPTGGSFGSAAHSSFVNAALSGWIGKKHQHACYSGPSPDETSKVGYGIGHLDAIEYASIRVYESS